MALEAALYYSDGIVGSNTKGGRADSSAVVEFNHQVYSPIDTQRGVPTSSRVHGPATLIIELDTAAPSLFQASCTGQTLGELRVEWFRINQMGQEELYFTHTFKEVKVASAEVILPNTKDPNKEQYRHLLELKLLYEEVEWKHEEGYEFVDGWKLEPA